MKNKFIILFFLLSFLISSGQNVPHRKYLSLGSRSFGLCFGNSAKYNGVRLNLWDKEKELETNLINGINISFSLIANEANGLQIGIIRTNTGWVNGIQIGGLATLSDKINGFSMGAIAVTAVKINGGAISFFVTSDTLNGVFFGWGIAANDPKYPKKIINGLAAGTIVVGAEKVRGITASFFWCYSKEHYGISIAGLNKTENLHGFQIGLLNYAGNNPKLFKWMPILNFHL